jgi:hypothetical protein
MPIDMAGFEAGYAPSDGLSIAGAGTIFLRNPITASPPAAARASPAATPLPRRRAA